MDAIECIRTRRSTRKYLQSAVEWDKITLILEAGSKAPSSGNLQDYRFILLTDKNAIREVAQHCTEQNWISKVPILVIVCADTERTTKYYGLRGQRLYSVQNAAAAAQNMLLMAHALGLGACWIGSFDENYVSDKLGIPETVRPQAIITIGYADGKPEHKDEEQLETLVSFNEYANKIKNWNWYLRNYSAEVEKFVDRQKEKLDETKDTMQGHFKKLVERAKGRLKK